MRRTDVTIAFRVAVLVALVWALISAREDRVKLRAQAPQIRSADIEEGRIVGERLLRNYPEALDRPSELEIKNALSDYALASRTVWLMGSTRTSLSSEQIEEGMAKAEKLFHQAVGRMAAGIGNLPGLILLKGEAPLSVTRTLALPFRSAVLIVGRGRRAQGVPHFMWKEVDLGSGKTIRIDLSGATDSICVLELLNPPHPPSRFQLRLTSGPELLANIDLSVRVPEQFPLRVDLRDEGGSPTEAAVGLYSSEKRFLVPATALDFALGGFNYQAVNYREHNNARFWPGSDGLTRCFFVKGNFTINLPAGSYRLIATKGPEYLPVDSSVSVGSGRTNHESIKLRRWINMSRRGWHSGDTHIHYARRDEKANQRLELWAQAEGLEMGNILRMGDAGETYFEQYAFGTRGRYLYEGGAFVPGQEDPRTGVLGHTINLNIQEPIRQPQLYYLYSDVFDEAHRQGGLSGYAHVNSDSFLVHRDMTINIPRHKVDFAEICEFGAVGTDLYYEFLNLGFRLTAVGGSDAPWGGTVGDSRVYAYTGGKFNPDPWFAAVRNGRTFVTAGPMLEFTVNGKLPGDEITVDEGTALKVHAWAGVGSSTVPLGRLEVIANGDAVRSVDSTGSSAALDFELPAEKSMWIAARATGAHTTPVYVTVGGKRHWKLSAVPALLEKRLRTLDEIEGLIDKKGGSIGVGHRAEWESREAFQKGSQELRKMIQDARAVYLQLQREVESGH